MAAAVASLQMGTLHLLLLAAPEGVRNPGTALNRILQEARGSNVVCLQQHNYFIGTLSPLMYSCGVASCTSAELA
jgi:hypothetical protein